MSAVLRRADDSAFIGMTPASDTQAAVLWHWFVDIAYQHMVQYGDGTAEHTKHPRYVREWRVLKLPAGQRPDPHDYMPAAALPVRCEAMPCTRFQDLPPEQRDRYRPQYAYYLKWRRADALGMHPDRMVDGVHYDSLLIDEAVVRWLSAGAARHAGC